MVNPKERYSADQPIDYGPIDIGICYFVDRRQVGEEVRFPRPPAVTEPETKKHALPREKPVTEPVTKKPQEEYKGYAYYAALRAKQRAIMQVICLMFWGGFLLCFWTDIPDYLLAKFGPQPSPLIIPAPPYYQGETIEGLSTNGVHHTWVYYTKAGWVDP